MLDDTNYIKCMIKEIYQLFNQVMTIINMNHYYEDI